MAIPERWTAMGAAVAALLAPAVADGASGGPGVVAGQVRALAVSGDAVIVARTLPGRRLVVERRVPGSPPRTLLRQRGVDFSAEEIRLAASARAVALSLSSSTDGSDGSDGSEALPFSRVLVGPVTGPLREVTRCQKGFLVPAVSVLGTRVAWGEGGCGQPAAQPVELGPAALAMADADPAVPVRRTPLPEDRIAGAIAQSVDSGLVGLYRPAFVSFIATEVRRFGADGLGGVALRRPGEVTLPVGIPDGSPGIVASSALDESYYGDRRSAPQPRCATTVFPLPDAGAAPRPIALSGCPKDDSASVAVTADRVVARVERASRPADRRRFSRTAIVSVRPDGLGRRTLVFGTYRGPDALAAGEGRVAWTQPHCAGQTELASSPVAPPRGGANALPSCLLIPLTRRARVRHNAITVRFRCPRGCSGALVDDSRCGSRYLRSFRSEGGIRAIRVRLGRRLRRAHRVLLRFRVDHGPQRLRAVALRR